MSYSSRNYNSGYSSPYIPGSFNSLLLGRHDFGSSSGLSRSPMYHPLGGMGIGIGNYNTSPSYLNYSSLYGNYTPKKYSSSSNPLPTISEHSHSNFRSSPRTYVPVINIPSTITSHDFLSRKPAVWNTEDIDVTTPRKVATPGELSRGSDENGFGTIRRGRTVIRIQTKHLKENPYLENGVERPVKQPKAAGDKFREKFMIYSKKKKYAGYRRPTLNDIRKQQEQIKQEIQETDVALKKADNEEKVSLEEEKKVLCELERKLTKKLSKAEKKAENSTAENSEDDKSGVEKKPKKRKTSAGTIKKSDVAHLQQGCRLTRKQTKRFFFPTDNGSEVEQSLVDKPLTPEIDDAFEKNFLANYAETLRKTIKSRRSSLEADISDCSIGLIDPDALKLTLKKNVLEEIITEEKEEGFKNDLVVVVPLSLAPTVVPGPTTVNANINVKPKRKKKVASDFPKLLPIHQKDAIPTQCAVLSEKQIKPSALEKIKPKLADMRSASLEATENTGKLTPKLKLENKSTSLDSDSKEVAKKDKMEAVNVEKKVETKPGQEKVPPAGKTAEQNFFLKKNILQMKIATNSKSPDSPGPMSPKTPTSAPMSPKPIVKTDDKSISSSPIDKSAVSKIVDKSSSSSLIEKSTAVKLTDKSSPTDKSVTAKINKSSSSSPVDNTAAAKIVDKSSSSSPIDKSVATKIIDKSSSSSPVDKTATAKIIDKSSSSSPTDKTAAAKIADKSNCCSPMEKLAAELGKMNSSSPVGKTKTDGKFPSFSPVDKTAKTKIGEKDNLSSSVEANGKKLDTKMILEESVSNTEEICSIVKLLEKGNLQSTLKQGNFLSKAPLPVKDVKHFAVDKTSPSAVGIETKDKPPGENGSKNKDLAIKKTEVAKILPKSKLESPKEPLSPVKKTFLPKSIPTSPASPKLCEDKDSGPASPVLNKMNIKNDNEMSVEKDKAKIEPLQKLNFPKRIQQNLLEKGKSEEKVLPEKKTEAERSKSEECEISSKKSEFGMKSSDAFGRLESNLKKEIQNKTNEVKKPAEDKVVPKSAELKRNETPKESPTSSQIKPKEIPKPVEVKPKESPTATLVKPKESPTSTQVKPKEVSKPLEVKPKDSPTSSQVKPKESPISSQIKPTNTSNPKENAFEKGKSEEPKSPPGGLNTKAQLKPVENAKKSGFPLKKEISVEKVEESKGENQGPIIGKAGEMNKTDGVSNSGPETDVKKTENKIPSTPPYRTAKKAQSEVATEEKDIPKSKSSTPDASVSPTSPAGKGKGNQSPKSPGMMTPPQSPMKKDPSKKRGTVKEKSPVNSKSTSGSEESGESSSESESSSKQEMEPDCTKTDIVLTEAAVKAKEKEEEGTGGKKGGGDLTSPRDSTSSTSSSSSSSSSTNSSTSTARSEGSTSTSSSSTISAGTSSTVSHRRMPSPPISDDEEIDEDKVLLNKICPVKSRPKYRKYAVEDFQFLKVLGKGSFGKVLLAELKGTDSYFAIKCLKKDVVLEDDDVECTMIERKVLLMGSRHPYLCHLFCTFQTESHLFFVMEYLNGGDLMFHIQQSGRFSEERARFYAAEIVSGLKFLHKKGIIYRDLKLDNILLDFEGHIRIADFGMCKLQIYLDRTADTFCGTPDYMAPEIIKGLRYNQCVDWWAFGILLYEMLIGQSPFSGSDEDELFWSVCNEAVHYPRFLSKEAKKILEMLLEKDSSKRLGTVGCSHGDVKEQPFFQPIDWERLEIRDLKPPFTPKLKHSLDVQYFDTTFTKEVARLTPVDKDILRSMDQSQFEGFSYTNPHTTD